MILPDKLQPSSPGPFEQTGRSGEDSILPSDDKEWFIRLAFESDHSRGVELLFRRYYKALCSHAVRFVYSKELAQDLVGEIFSTFIQKEIHRQIRSSFRAYLFSAVRFEALKYLQREFNRETGIFGTIEQEFPSTLPTPEETVQFDDLSQKIEQAIQSLSPAVQRVFILNRFEGRKYQEIAQELMLSQKTVEAHMTKALRVLREVVKDY